MGAGSRDALIWVKVSCRSVRILLSVGDDKRGEGVVSQPERKLTGVDCDMVA